MTFSEDSYHEKLDEADVPRVSLNGDVLSIYMRLCFLVRAYKDLVELDELENDSEEV